MTAETNAFLNFFETDKDGAEMTSAGRSSHKRCAATLLFIMFIWKFSAHYSESTRP